MKLHGNHPTFTSKRSRRVKWHLNGGISFGKWETRDNGEAVLSKPKKKSMGGRSSEYSQKWMKKSAHKAERKNARIFLSSLSDPYQDVPEFKNPDKEREVNWKGT